MNAKITSAILLLCLDATLASAQQPSGQQTLVSDRVAKSVPTKYEPAQCDIKPNHFKVGSGAGYVKSAGFAQIGFEGIATDEGSLKRAHGQLVELVREFPIRANAAG